MNKIINRYQAVCGTLWLIIFCIVITLWPLRLVHEKIVSGSNRQITMSSEAITEEYTVQQMFVAQYDHLQSIRVYLLNESAGETFNFILYDASHNILMQQFISTDAMEEMPGFCTIQVNQETEVGREYYYLLQGVSTDFYVAYEDTETSGTIYNGTLYYGNVEDTEHNIIAEYEYRIPLRKGKTLVCDALFVMLGLIITICAKKYYGRYPEKNRLLTVEMVWKHVASPLVIIAALVGIIAVWPCKLFSEYAENNIFFIIGIVLAAGVLLYGINRERFHKSSDLGLSVLRDHLTDYLQAGCFAFAIQAGVHYMNGLYEIHHTIAYREMLLWLALAVIVTYKRKEIFHVVNLVYVVIAGIGGYLYYQNQVVSLDDDEKIQALKLTVWAAVIAGIVIINTVSLLLRKESSRKLGRSLNLWYGALLTIFFVLLIVFRNTRGWPIYLVCIYTLFYIRIAVWEKKERILQNICNGILLHFLVMTGYCLLHRPYMFHIYYRYPFIFHTVTVSAVYLLLAACAALVKLLDRYRKDPRLSCIWKELIVFGIACVYLIFTLSRTGYLAFIIMALIIVPLACLGLKSKGKAFLKAAAMMLLSAVLCFVPVFTMQRIFPAVVAQPETLEIEELPSEIVHGRDMDSWYYITPRRFLHVFELKVLGIPEEKCIFQYNIAAADKKDMSDRLKPDKMLVASADLSGAAIPEEPQSDADSYTNGRLDIFRLYAMHLDMTGHDDMGITLPNGSLVVHAHNIYLQVAYDHGIPVGIVFILFGIGTFIQAVIYFIRRKNDRACAILPLALLLSFAVAGLTEWIFHPCYPIAFCLLLSLAPLLTDAGASKEGIGRNGEETKTV
ncbi:MAG: hypothetical protein NC434_03815 [Ruminococcus sp.]|nr:hypothetical protein [Ruminococcus sp.]